MVPAGVFDMQPSLHLPHERLHDYLCGSGLSLGLVGSRVTILRPGAPGGATDKGRPLAFGLPGAFGCVRSAARRELVLFGVIGVLFADCAVELLNHVLNLVSLGPVAAGGHGHGLGLRVVSA